MERKLTGILLDTALYFLIVLLWLIFQKLGLAEGAIVVNAIAAAIGWCIAKFVIDPVKRIRNRYS